MASKHHQWHLNHAGDRTFRSNEKMKETGEKGEKEKKRKEKKGEKRGREKHNPTQKMGRSLAGVVNFWWLGHIYLELICQVS